MVRLLDEAILVTFIYGWYIIIRIEIIEIRVNNIVNLGCYEGLFTRKFPLNHFVLWCKGWYKPSDSLEPIEVTLSKVLKLDGHSFVKSLKIVLNELEPYNEWLSKNNRKPLKLTTIYYEASRYEAIKAFQGKGALPKKLLYMLLKTFYGDWYFLDGKLLKYVNGKRIN